MRILGIKTIKHTCGRRIKTEEMQKNKNVVNSLADVIRKNKRDAASNNEKVVLSWIKAYFISSFFVSTSQESRDSKHNFRRI